MALFNSSAVAGFPAAVTKQIAAAMSQITIRRLEPTSCIALPRRLDGVRLVARFDGLCRHHRRHMVFPRSYRIPMDLVLADSRRCQFRLIRVGKLIADCAGDGVDAQACDFNADG